MRTDFGKELAGMLNKATLTQVRNHAVDAASALIDRHDASGLTTEDRVKLVEDADKMQRLADAIADMIEDMG